MRCFLSLVQRQQMHKSGDQVGTKEMSPLPPETILALSNLPLYVCLI